VYLVITKGFLAFATQPRDLEKTAFQLRLSEREFNYNRIRMRMVDPETFEPIVVTAANLGSAGANSGGWFFELLP
jgi:hypothetical protein